MRSLVRIGRQLQLPPSALDGAILRYRGSTWRTAFVTTRSVSSSSDNNGENGGGGKRYTPLTAQTKSQSNVDTLKNALRKRRETEQHLVTHEHSALAKQDEHGSLVAKESTSGAMVQYEESPETKEPFARRVFFGAAHLWAAAGALVALLYFFLGPRQNRLERNTVLNSTRELRFLRVRAKRALLAACPHEELYGIRRGNNLRVFDSQPNANSSTCTVILPAEDGETAALWGFVAVHLIDRVRVIAYHRQASDTSEQREDTFRRRSMMSKFHDLREVINRKRINGKVVLVAQDESTWSSLLFGAVTQQHSSSGTTFNLFGGKSTPEIIGAICVTPKYFPQNRVTRFWDAVKQNSRHPHKPGMEREWSKPRHVDTTGEITRTFQRNIGGADSTVKTFAKFFGNSAGHETANYGDQYVDDAYSRLPVLSQLEKEFLNEYLPTVQFPVHVLFPHPETMPWDFGREKQELLATSLFQAANAVGHFMDPRGHYKTLLEQRHSEKGLDKDSESLKEKENKLEENPAPSTSFLRWIKLRLAGTAIEKLYPWRSVSSEVSQIQAPYYPTLIHNVTGNMYSIPLQAPQSISTQVQELLSRTREQTSTVPVYGSLWGWWPPMDRPTPVSSDKKPRTIFREMLL
eukprot:gb/GECG01007664.1/.p1 GENE.gb/GECG01007664.1/~~gb/GECG01007664.1/.p1  ORF type:complete len:633 (+),score=77.15 gb/GECG01007664.1/:1-1899(+)